MDAFNKQFIDTEELQSEITKLKNSIINSITNKDNAVIELLKSDVESLKIFNATLKFFLQTYEQNIIL